ncbi:MAG: hypothetical protein ACE5EK_03015 [Nitrospinales bacterium]
MGKSSQDYGDQLLFQLKAAQLPLPVPEYKFHPSRRWRFDYAYTDINLRLAIEIEGGIWSGGRHTRGKGYEKDCVKYNTAALHGWTVYRFTPGHIESGYALDTIQRALKPDKNSNYSGNII